MDIIKDYNEHKDGWKTTIIDSSEIKLNEKIGSGATGTVLNGIWKDKNVICKCAYLSDYDDILELFEDIDTELYNYSKLKNTKYCCELYGVSWNEKNKSLILVLKNYNVKGDLHDYIDGSEYWNHDFNTLYTSIWENKKWFYNMKKKEKIEITISLCNAIEELHERDIVHCDLKTNNLLYCPKEKKAIIIDFGASKFMDGERYERISRNWGTVGYTCEILNKGICHKKADIYSLSVCILEVWCGNIWNDSKDHHGSRLEVLRSLRILEKNEKELVKILRKGLHKNMDQRPYIKTFNKKIRSLF